MIVTERKDFGGSGYRYNHAILGETDGVLAARDSQAPGDGQEAGSQYPRVVDPLGAYKLDRFILLGGIPRALPYPITWLKTS